VALDGVSLTVNAVEGDRFEVLLIPHTLEVTTLSGWKVGDRVNIEVDQMARYAARLVEAGGFAAATPLSPLAGRGLG
jgi:riboflavin synthase